MVCHEFKGGIGTASRVIRADLGGYTVGALVQANYGKRAWLRIDGVRVGEAIPTSEVPSPWSDQAGGPRRHRQAPARSSSSSRRTRRCCPTSASAWPSAPASGSPASAAPAATRAATCSSPSPPAIASRRGWRTRRPGRARDLRRAGRRRRRHRPAVRRDHRVDRGGHRQRARRRTDRDRSGRHHGPCPAARPAARGHGRRTADEPVLRPVGRRRPTLERRPGRRSSPRNDEPSDLAGPDRGCTALPRRTSSVAAGSSSPRRTACVVGLRRLRAVETGRVRFLTDLFVDPEQPGRRHRPGRCSTRSTRDAGRG